MKNKIIESSINLFIEKGYSFTVDDISRELKISKKTIYKYFKSKEDIFKEFIILSFESIHKEQDKIFSDKNLSIKEKLIKILNMESIYEKKLPMEKTMEIDKYYPTLYDLIMETYETHWDNVILLINQGKKEGIFKNTISTNLIKELFIQVIKINHNPKFVESTHLSYRQSIKQSMEIILDGISNKKEA